VGALVKQWQAVLISLSLLSIAISLLFLGLNVHHIAEDIDMGKLMPFIYTGDK
jgi:hypothetical protein